MSKNYKKELIYSVLFLLVLFNLAFVQINSQQKQKQPIIDPPLPPTPPPVPVPPVVPQNIQKLTTAHQSFLDNQKLTSEMEFKKKYIIQVDQQSFKKDVPNYQKGGRFDFYYLWVNIEPKEGTVYQQLKMKIQIKDEQDNQKYQKVCQSEGGIDSCFVINRKFDFNTDSIYVKVTCQQQCSYKISSTINQRMRITPNTSIELDFENTAYTQVFNLNYQEMEFQELRIILKPIKFLNYPAPIQMYANKGWRTPDKQSHDFKSIHIWDDGLGIFLHKKEIQNVQGWGKGLTISITGPQKNALALENYFLKQGQQRILTAFQPQFDYAASQLMKRKYNFPVKNKEDNIYIRVEAFHGKVQIEGLFNKQTGQRIQQTNFYNEQFSQINLKIPSQQLKKSNPLNIQVVLTAKKPSTYMIQYNPSTSQALQYLKNSQTRYSQLEGGKTDQYVIKLFEIYDQDKKKVKFSIKTKNLKGNLEAKFFYCNETDENKCKKKTQALSSVDEKGDLLPALIDSSGIDRVYHIQVQWQKLIKKEGMKQDFRQLKIIVAIVNKNISQILEYFIKYQNYDRIYLLKQQETLKQRVDEDQIKIFKFSVLGNNRQIEQIQIHTTEISGKVKFQGHFDHPKLQDAQNSSSVIHLRHRTLHFQRKDFINLNSPSQFKNDSLKNQRITVYVKATGKQFAFFSLTPQVIRGPLIPNDNKTQKDDFSKGFNQLIIQNDLTYTFIIRPGDRMVFQAKPPKNFFAYIQTSQPLQICMTQNLTVPPFRAFNNCQVQQNVLDKRSTSLFMQYKYNDPKTNGTANFGVENRNSQNVTFSFKIGTYHNDTKNSSDTNSTETKYSCQQGILGQITQHNIIKNDIYCLKYTITKKEDIAIMLDFQQQTFNDHDGTISVRINKGKQKYNLERRYDKIEKEKLIKDCGDVNSLCEVQVIIQEFSPSRLYIITQYANDDIRLVQGMAYKFKGKVPIKTIKHFSYLILDSGDNKQNIKSNVTVSLQNKAGYFKFYAKLIPDYLFNSQNQSQNFPTLQEINTNSSNLLISVNPFYYLQQTLYIERQKIRNKCGQGHCILAISVLNDNQYDDQSKIRKFIIEVSQIITYLRQGQVVAKYLQKDSNAYYQYFNPKNGTVALTINDENRNCIDIYWASIYSFTDNSTTNGTIQKASKQSSKAEKGIFQAPSGRISIMLNAKDSCPYSLQIISNDQQIGTLKRGIFTDVNLQKQQYKSFIYEHQMPGQTFKVLTLHKKGQLLIQVKKYENGNLTKIIEDSKSSIMYEKSGVDMVRIQNVAKNTTNHIYYLVKVTATKLTKGSIFIPTDGVQIPISQDQLLKDELFQNQKQIFRVYTGRIAKFMLNMNHGEVRIQIQNQNNSNPKVFQYKTEKDPIIQEFQISNNKSNQNDPFYWQFMSFNRVTIKAKKLSSFIFALISSQNATERELDVKFGTPYYLYLDNATSQKCLVGVTDSQMQQYIVASPDYGYNSTNNNSISQLSNLNITAYLNDKVVPYTKEETHNQMVIYLKWPTDHNWNYSGVNYKFCFSASQWYAITFIQSGHVNAIDQNHPFLFTKQANITFYSDGSNILQLNECRGKMVVYISSQFNKIKALASNITVLRKRQNILEFDHYGAVFINAQGQKGTILWKRKNLWQNKNVGYDLYKTSSLRYKKQSSTAGGPISIAVIGNALQMVNPERANITLNQSSKAVLRWVKYKAVAAVQQTHLDNAINCNQGSQNTVQVQITRNGNQSNFNDQVSLRFDIQQLRKKFKHLAYFVVNIQALAQIEIVSNTPNTTYTGSQIYRFYYQEQQITKQYLIRDDQVVIEPQPYVPQQESTLLTWVSYIILVLVLIMVGVFLYRKFLRRCLTGRRNNFNGELYSGSQVQYREY